MAVFGNLFGGGQRRKPVSEMTPEERAAAAMDASYLGVNPAVDKAYKTDPRTMIAQSLMGNGASMDPVAGGMTEGIARALSGLAGGYVGRQQRQKYDEYDDLVNTGANSADKSTLAKAGYGKSQTVPAVAAPGPASPFTLGQNPMTIQPSGGASMVANALTQQGAPQQAPALPGNPPRPGPSPVSQPLTPPQGFQQTPAPASPRVLTPGEPAGVRRRANYQSYQSPDYEPLEAQMEQKYNLPSGTLRGLRMAERSNADQVSPTGARTVYQFVRGTRRGMVKNYGVDPYAGPEQAVEAAALHVRESLDRGRDMDGALRDYRGVDEGADPGWYARARGEIGGEAQQQTPVEAAPPVPVPAMPNAPKPVERPSLGERVKSARLETAMSMLEGNPGMDASLLRAGLNEYLDKGYDEEQASRIQRDENESQLTNQSYSSQLQGFNQGEGDMRQAGITANRDATLENYARGRAATEQEYALERQREQDRAALQREQVEAAARGNKRPPVAVTNGYLARRSLRRTMSEISDRIKAYPDSVQWAFGNIPPSALVRYDPQGLQTRAAIASLTGNILHELSGAAVTDSEAKRLLPMLPTMNDTPKAIRDKIERLSVQFEAMDLDARTLYSNGDGTSMFDALEAQALTSAAAAQQQQGGRGPVANGSSADDDLVNKYLQ